MPRDSLLSLQEAQDQSQHRTYTSQHCLCGIRIRRSGRNGKIVFILLPKGKTISIPLLTIPMTHPVACAAFSPDGNQIVSGPYDQTVRVWDAKTGEQLKEMHGHFNFVASVAFSSDGNRIVSGSEDYSVRVGCQYRRATEADEAPAL